MYVILCFVLSILVFSLYTSLDDDFRLANAKLLSNISIIAVQNGQQAAPERAARHLSRALIWLAANQGSSARGGLPRGHALGACCRRFHTLASMMATLVKRPFAGSLLHEALEEVEVFVHDV